MCPMHGRIARLGRWTAGPVTAWAPAGAVAAGGNDIESLDAAPKNVSQALARVTVSTPRLRCRRTRSKLRSSRYSPSSRSVSKHSRVVSATPWVFDGSHDTCVDDG